MEIVDANLSLQLRGFFPDYQWNYVADAILERTMGKVLVDDLNNPQVVALTLPKFRLHIMGGNADHPAARDYLSGLSSFTTLFVGKSGWKDALDETLAGKVVILKRYAFSSESLDIENLKSVRSKLAEGFRLEKINLEYAKQIIAGKSDLLMGCCWASIPLKTSQSAASDIARWKVTKSCVLPLPLLYALKV